MPGSSQQLVKSVKKLVPTSVKKRVWKALPVGWRYYANPDWHRNKIGNVPNWDYMGKIQLDYLVERGLRPEHTLLDVGCGPLRAGVHFIGYLEPGHYAGIDVWDDVLEIARQRELPRHGLVEKHPQLLANGLFEFSKFGMTFDYAMAQSVFTHLPLNNILRCLVEMGRVLNPGGRFYASIYENPHGKLFLEDIRQSDTGTSHYDADIFHYDVDTLRWACEGTGLTLEYEGDFGHPKNQKMLVFVKSRE